MLRRQARLRREYIYRKSIEDRQRVIEDKKRRIAHAIEHDKPVPTSLKQSAVKIHKSLGWIDEGGEGPPSHIDDEYRVGGIEDPKIMITTSRAPSSRLKMFAKELKLIFPNAQRTNRGHYEMKELIEACRANGATDVIIAHEHRGDPDGIIVCHLPFGPTAYFTLLNVVMRHDIADLGPMSEQYPHLIFENFKAKLGQRAMSILKYLFPVPKADSHRVVTFANEEDTILFRHHCYKMDGPNPVLSEIGPRFEMKLYRLLLGTLDALDAAEVEWEMRPFMRTAKKHQYLSVAADEDA